MKKMKTMIPMRENSLSISSIRDMPFEYSRFLDKTGKTSSPHYTLFKINGVVPPIVQKAENIPVRKDIRNSLENISDNNDLIDFSKKVFPKSKQYLFDLLTEVIKDFYQEEENSEFSTESLKGILLFLYSLKKFKRPEISISETGVFYIDWEEEINNSLTVRFKDDFFLEYSLFQPSDHSDKWNIRNGKIHVLDFINDLSKLGINLHKEV
jgi:hypothetical protein